MARGYRMVPGTWEPQKEAQWREAHLGERGQGKVEREGGVSDREGLSALGVHVERGVYPRSQGSLGRWERKKHPSARQA